MNYCYNCGTRIEVISNFCPNCGVNLNTPNSSNDEIVSTEPKSANKKNKSKQFKSIFVICIAVIVFVSIISIICSGGKKITIEKLLEIETKEDVVKLVGLSKNDSDETSCDVKLAGDEYLFTVDYDGNNVDEISLEYEFAGLKNADTLGESMNYVPSNKDISRAYETLEKLLISFTEALGEPSVFNSKANTTTCTWNTDCAKIEITDYINSDLNWISAISVKIQYK